MNKLVLTSLLVLTLSGCSLFAPVQTETEEQLPLATEEQSEETTEEEPVEEPGDETSADPEEASVDLSVDVETSVASLGAPVYQDYSEAKRSQLLADGKAHAIFFHASWCPTCIQMEKVINEELSSFPAGTNILVADYDTETELKKEYGIRTQSTIVVVGSNGEKLVTLSAPDNATLKAAIEDSL